MRGRNLLEEGFGFFLIKKKKISVLFKEDVWPPNINSKANY